LILKTPWMSRQFVVVSLLLLQSLAVSGQRKAIDSLQQALTTTSDKEQRVDLYIAISAAIYDYDSERGFENASYAYSLADELKDVRRKRKALTLKGYYYFVKGKYSMGLKLYQESLNQPLPEDEDYVYALAMTGNLFRVTARYDSAEAYYKKGIAILNARKTTRHLAYINKHLARLYLLEWRNQEAEDALLKALRLYDSTGNKNGKTDTYFALADVYKNKADFPKAVSYVEQACALTEETKDEFMGLYCVINRGNIKLRIGEYPQALQLYIQAMSILKSKDMPLLQTQLYMNIGDVYRALQENEVSLKYYHEALKIAERIGIKYEIAKAYGSLANVYRNLGNLPKSIEANEKSIKLRTEINDQHGISQCYTNQAMIFQKQKQYDQAIEYLNRTLEIRKKINYREGIPSSLYNLSTIYAELGQNDKSLAYQQQALALEESIGNKYTMGFSNNQLGSIYTRLKRLPQAERHLRKAQQLANETKSQNLRMTNELNWSAWYEAKGNGAAAFKHYRLYSAAHDSLSKEVSTQKLEELQALYVLERKDQEIALLNQDKLIQDKEIALQRSKINQQNIVIVSGLISLLMVSVLAVVIFSYNRRLKKAHREITEQKEEIQSQSEELIDANQTIAEINKKLEGKIEERTQALSQAYKELDTFFYRSSHDFRRPLTTFLGLAEVAKVTVKDHNALELFEKVKETAVNLDKMLVKLQSISDVGSQQLVFKEVLIKEIFDTVCDTFRDEIHRKNIKVSSEIKLNDPFISYPAMVKIIIENLVENAVAFSGINQPHLKLKAVQTGDYITIDVQDNGQGIARELQEQIFDMYYRANERSKGNGLGLYIVKKAVEKLDGSISVSSILQIGTTFSVMLPRAHRFS
jgi:signal transduction histidine kinase